MKRAHALGMVLGGLMVIGAIWSADREKGWALYVIAAAAVFVVVGVVRLMRNPRGPWT